MKKTLITLIIANAFTATTAFAAADVGTGMLAENLVGHTILTPAPLNRAIITVKNLEMLAPMAIMLVAVYSPVIKLHHGSPLKVVMII